MDKRLHIVSFDVPLPANYGGVIDVFYKIKALHAEGIKIILHSYVYGERQKNEVLEQYCEQVFYYKRLTGVQGLSLLRPYIVNSRKNATLLKNLLPMDAPILFEGLHTCYYLNHPRLANRKKYVRAHNIEHEYYKALANAESKIWKRLFYKWESYFLKAYEEILKHAADVIPISETDYAYFSIKYASELVPAFHENERVTSQAGRGEYCLYQGNLAVAENEQAVLHLLETVFSKLTMSIKIAGANPSENLRLAISSYAHIELIENPTMAAMHELMQNAHVHVLYAAERSGMKLKLLNSLFQGRFVVANKNILLNSNWEAVATRVEGAAVYLTEIKLLWEKDFTQADITQRKNLMENYFSNNRNAAKLIKIIFN